LKREVASLATLPGKSKGCDILVRISYNVNASQLSNRGTYRHNEENCVNWNEKKFEKFKSQKMQREKELKIIY